MNRVCPPPASADHAGFLRSLDRAAMATLIGEHLVAGGSVVDLRPGYVRWKDHHGSLVGWHTTVQHDGGTVATYVTARSAPLGRLRDEAGRLGHRADEAHDGLRAFALLPDAELLLLAFPLDRDIPDLRRMVRASKVRTLLQDCPGLLPAGTRFSKSRSRCTLVRYKPERRAVLRWDVGVVDGRQETRAELPVWVRLCADEQATRSRIALAAAAAAGVRVPQLLSAPHERLLVESHLPGTGWSAGDQAGAAAAAAALARLHAASPPHGLPVHGTIAELDLALQAVEDLARLDHRLGTAAAAVADRLAQTVPPASAHCLLHGDFHRGQVLLGEPAGLCDFDRAAIGPVAADLASFAAHVLVAGEPVADLHTMLAAYGHWRDLPRRSELAWWFGATLLRTAITPFRALHPDWPALVEAFVAQAGRAEELLP